MNKIVIIGNGFDLAHGLPTRYGDFMEYLSNKIIEVKGKKIHNVGEEVILRRDNSKMVIFKDSDGNLDPWIGAAYDFESQSVKLKTIPKEQSNSIYFKSLFDKNNKDGKWSDLEAHYYKLIKDLAIKMIDKSDENKKSYLRKISIINQEFDHLKKLLEDYLKHEIEDEIDKKYEIDKSNVIYGILNNHMGGGFQYYLNNTYFVSFNYSEKLLKQYVNWLREEENEISNNIPVDPIHIHGDLLKDNNNPIIFGYGDDNSEEYKQIQDLKENELLRNFKTFQYLRSNRYRQVLGLLSQNTQNGGITDILHEEDVYIQVIGHSLDIGDRALLKTIFQHPNVKHVELTYHNKEENYFENLYNVSRIFDDNTLMREKIIPLEYTHNITTGMTLNQKKALEKQN